MRDIVQPMNLMLGDCLQVMRGMEAESVDAIVTDPPYGLSFMGKKWDYDVPSVEVWRECLRVLKPGGHLLAFAGTRTQHRMACNIEDAGFEIRDMIAWVYGSGFPKSLDVSKAIDNAGGVVSSKQAKLLRDRRELAGMSREEVAKHIGCTPSSVRDWEEGRARAVGAPIEFIIPSPEYRTKLAILLGYSSDERRLIGETTDRRGDGSVYGVGHSGEVRSGGHTDAAKQWSGWGTALKPAMEPITVARKPLIGTVAENVLRHGTGAINVDGCRVEMASEEDAAEHRYNCEGGYKRQKNWHLNDTSKGTLASGWKKPTGEPPQVQGRFPANIIHDGSDEVVGLFPQAGNGWKRNYGEEDYKGRQYAGGSFGGGGYRGGSTYCDSGSAARFFYCAKASKRDRDEGCEGLEERVAGVGDVDESSGRDSTKPGNQYGEGSRRRVEAGLSPTMPRRNHHPTVKPTDLMRYLCRLVTPPNGIVLDPFMGSGSTGKACVLEGFGFIGIEREADYIEIARARIEACRAK